MRLFNCLLLLQASKNGKFRSVHIWGVQLILDMNFKIAVPTSQFGQYDIFEIFKPGLETGITINKVASYESGKLIYFRNISFYDSRKNLSGVLLRSGNTINYTFENPSDYEGELRNKERGTFGKFDFQLFLGLKHIHKFHYNTTIRNAWFGNSSSGIDGGVAKCLHEKTIDISSAGGILRYGRMDYYDFLLPYFKFRTCFFFRNPGIVKPGTDVLKPFSVRTWYATISAALLIGLAIKFSYWIEYKFLNSHTRYSFFTSMVITVAICAQQGSAIFPRHLGGRIIFLNLLILSILLYNYYTSSLVSSLLSSKPTVFTSIKDLYESNLEIATEDQPYTTTYILQQENDSYIQKLNSTKIYRFGRPNYMPPVEGIAMMKKGGLAYHTEVTTAYPLIAKSFEQEVICDLVEIDFVAPGIIGFMVTKKSEYRELFQISLLKMRTGGIFKREDHIWSVKKPECLLSLRVLSVGRNELFLVYLILLAGILISSLILIVEITWFRLHSNQRSYLIQFSK